MAPLDRPPPGACEDVPSAYHSAYLKSTLRFYVPSTLRFLSFQCLDFAFVLLFIFPRQSTVPESYRPPGCKAGENSGQFRNFHAFKTPCKASKQPPEYGGRSFPNQGLLQMEHLCFTQPSPGVSLPQGNAHWPSSWGSIYRRHFSVKGKVASSPFAFPC